MILTVNDFDGYNNDCDTIKKIKSWIEDQGGSFEMKDMIAVFEKETYSFKSQIVRYLNAQHLHDYIKDFIFENEPFEFWQEIVELKKDIENKSKKFGSIILADELLKKEHELETKYQNKNRLLDEQLDKYKDFSNMNELLELNQNLKKGWNYKNGTVLQVLNYFFSQSFQYQSYQTTNSVMYSVLNDLCTVAYFEEDDFSQLIEKFNFRYWGLNSLESFYGRMIVSGNNSAWKSFEKAFSRTPFILKNRRMYQGLTFSVFLDNKWTIFRCTGWNEIKKIKFVIDKEEKQKRFAFDNKEFRTFFKDKQIEF